MAISTARASSARSSTASRSSPRCCRSSTHDAALGAAAAASMANFVALLIAGLATGALYALVAVGFTLLWQTSQTINFAQGEFVMLPAFFVLTVMNLGAPFWLAAPIGIALSILILGLMFKLVIVDPMLKHGVLPLVVSTIALSLFLKEAAKDFYSPTAQP